MKEGKVFKRILAVALVVVMTITMVPFGVFAAEGTGDASVACEHVFENVSGQKAPTCTEAGNERYYKCSKCEVLAKDAEGTQIIASVADVAIPATGHAWSNATCTTPKTCTTCGATEGTVGGHSWVAATCTAPKTCSVCNTTEGDAAGHSWATTYTVDTPATCKTVGKESKHCTVAGCTAKTDERDIAKVAHTYDKTLANGICTVCGAVCAHNDNPSVAIPEVAATCTTDGSKNGFKCADCGKTVIEPKKVDKLGHDIEVIEGTSPTCTETGKSDGQRCKRCDYKVDQITLNALGHSWSATKQTVKDSTCTAKGSKAIICTREGCNAIKEGSAEEIAMKEHDYKAKAVTKEATCDEAGEKARVCKNCTAKTDIEVINALGHDWDDGTVKVAADCQKAGTTTFKCKRTGCGKTEDRKVEQLECDYVETIKEPTCEEDGYSTFTCTMCKSKYIDKKVDKFNHSFITYVQDENTATCYSDGTKTAECDHGCGKTNTIVDENSKIDHKLTDFTTIKEATCTEEGEEEAKCFYYDKCGYSESYPTDPLGHTVTKDTQFTVDKPATCTEKGSQSKHCERCDYTEGTEEIPALGHDYQPGAGTDATCTTGGHIKYVCTRCSDSYDVDNAEPLGHDFKYVSNNNATCKEDGTETGKCSRCDVVDTRTEVGSKLPHTLGEAVVVPASTEENGSSTTTCTVCGEVVESIEIAKIAKLSLKYTKATYNGDAKIPKLTITDANGNALVKGTDYTVVIPTKKESAKIGTHTYTVTFMGNYEGEEEVSYKVLPGTSSKVTAEKKQTEIKLSWKAVKGAVGYRVYVYNKETKKYDIVAKYVKGGKTTYTVKNLKANTTYKFAIKAYGKDDEGTVIWAAESLKASFKTLVTKTSKITATPSTTSVKLSWKKVSGADGYRVYVYNTKTKKYNIVEKNVTGTSYTVKGLKSGTSYKFAVKAYDTVSKKTVWSNQYTTVSVKTK